MRCLEAVDLPEPVRPLCKNAAQPSANGSSSFAQLCTQLTRKAHWYTILCDSLLRLINIQTLPASSYTLGCLSSPRSVRSISA